MTYQRGFTLIELVLSFAILGIIAIGFLGFLNVGANVYQNVSGRDALIASARFAVQRLNRELANALPNSIRISQNGYCLEYVPVEHSNVYLSLPTRGSESEPVILVNKQQITDIDISAGQRLVVYPLSADDAYVFEQNKAANITNLVAGVAENTVQLQLSGNVVFAADSPNERYFIVAQPVTYCVVNGQLQRAANYGFLAVPPNINDGILMAENLSMTTTAPFAFDSKLQSDAIVQVTLSFVRDGETVFFSNGVHIRNVP